MKNDKEHAAKLMQGLLDDIAEDYCSSLTDPDYLGDLLEIEWGYDLDHAYNTHADRLDFMLLHEAWRNQPTPTDEIAEQWAEVLIALELL